MKLQRKYLVGITVTLMLIGLSLGILEITQSRVDTTLQDESNNGPSGPQVRGLQGPSEPARSGTLNTVDYALGVVKDTVVVPDASRVSLDYKIIGVDVKKAPGYETTSNGITYRNWILVFVISDKPFVNGTTLNTELAGHTITVFESVSTRYGNSHDAAVNRMTLSPICVTDLKTGEETCTPNTNPNPRKLVQIRDTYLAVDPEAPNAYFQIDEDVNRRVTISGDLSYKQLLALADSMIP